MGGVVLPMAISPADALALVQLKSLLGEARSASLRPGVSMQLIATVLLDAVNESALNLAATSLGLSADHRDNFDGLKSKVQTELGGSWSVVTTTWRDVYKLHLARNLAQHHGIRPDKAQMQGWRAATERFASSIVQVLFGDALGSIFLSDALEDAEIRGEMKAAEALLESPGSVEEAAKKIFASFSTASRRWRDQVASGRSFIRASKPSFRQIGDRKSFEYLDQVSEMSADLVQHQVFGPGAGEYEWYRSLVKDGAEHVNREELKRAFSFVFWWIVDWQAVSPDLGTDRRERALIGLRSERMRDEPASIADISVEEYGVRSTGDPTRAVKIRMKCCSIPALGGPFNIWTQEVRIRLAEIAGIAHPYVDLSGEISFNISYPNDQIETMVARIGEILIEVEPVLKGREQAAVQAVTAEEDARRDFDRSAREYMPNLPDWVELVRLGDEVDRYNSTSVRVYLASDYPVANLVSAFRDAPDIEFAADYREYILLAPRLSISRLGEIICSASSAVESHKELLDQVRNEYLAEMGEIRAHFLPLRS